VPQNTVERANRREHRQFRVVRVGSVLVFVSGDAKGELVVSRSWRRRRSFRVILIVGPEEFRIFRGTNDDAEAAVPECTGQSRRASARFVGVFVVGRWGRGVLRERGGGLGLSKVLRVLLVDGVLGWFQSFKHYSR
jgi:hypothetical protein